MLFTRNILRVHSFQLKLYNHYASNYPGIRASTGFNVMFTFSVAPLTTYCIYCNVLLMKRRKIRKTVYVNSLAKDFPVPNSNIIIRKGDFVRLNTIGMTLDPEIHANPMEYNPDRFLKEYAEDRNPYSFLPFSLGPRNCIGMRFAMYEMKCCISSLVSKFRFIPCDKTVAYENLEFSKTDVFGGTTHGLWIKCEER